MCLMICITRSFLGLICFGILVKDPNLIWRPLLAPKDRPNRICHISMDRNEEEITQQVPDDQIIPHIGYFMLPQLINLPPQFNVIFFSLELNCKNSLQPHFFMRRCQRECAHNCNLLKGVYHPIILSSFTNTRNCVTQAFSFGRS